MIPDRNATIVATYLFESEIDPEQAAERLCEEQSTAQWKRVGVDEDFRPQHGAKILNLEVLTTKDRGSKLWTARTRLATPHINFGPKLPNLLTAVCGEGAFCSPGIATIKLLDLEFPDPFLEKFQGPQFGVEGVRKLLNIHDRPIFAGVVKPNIGLAPKDFAELAYQSWLGGLDAPKDDEMLADAQYSTLEERTKLLGKLKKKAEEKTGQKKMFIANITDEVDRLQDLHDIAVNNGVNAVMLNSWLVGLSAGRVLRKNAKVPLVGHFDFIPAFSRMPSFGMSAALAIKLQRLAGFDMIIFPGTGDRMKTTREEMLACVHACLDPMGKIPRALPMPGGSDWVGALPDLYQTLGTADFGVVPGRAVFNHPAGPMGGAKAYVQAWEAIRKKIPLEQHATKNTELQQALKTPR